MQRYIEESTIAGVLHFPQLIPVMRQTMIDFSLGKFIQPPRKIFRVQSHNGYFGSMPAAGENNLGAKLVTFYPENSAKDLPTHMAVIVLFQPETGEPMAMMDGRLITEMRTAAVTAVYIDAVAGSNVNTLAILGAGTQGRIHIKALSHVRKFKEIRIWNRTRKRAEKLAEEVGGKVTSCERAVRDADVVIAATSSAEPILQGKWLKPGAKIATVGYAGSSGAEVDMETMSNTIVVDSREGALTESGNILRYNAEIYAELGEVLAGTKLINNGSTVVFDSIGMACQDIAAAKLVYDNLKKKPA